MSQCLLFFSRLDDWPVWTLAHISVELIKLKTATKLAARKSATNIVHCQCPTSQYHLYFTIASCFIAVNLLQIVILSMKTKKKF